MASSGTARARPVTMAATILEVDAKDLYDEYGHRRSNPSTPTTDRDHFSADSTGQPAIPPPQCSPAHHAAAPALSAAPAAHRMKRKTRPEKILISLRSNSGLSMHTNEIALRQYTDYNPDGSPRSPLFSSPWRPESVDGQSIQQVSAGSRPNTTTTRNASSASLAIPDFLSREVFQMALNNPTTCRRLLRYAEAQECGDNVEFLVKLQEYSRSLETLTSLLGQISTCYTSSYAATAPLNLPNMLSKHLNTDIKNVTTSILPGLEVLFLEARCFIEDRVYRDVYSGFVRYQLGLTARLSLASKSSGNPAAYPTSPHKWPPVTSDFFGLGDCFCITDSLLGDNRISHSSDGFINLTGYSRQEVSRNCRFLQGPQTDTEAVSRLRDGIKRNEEVVELLLNYRKDGQPFWNLLWVAPLHDGSGKARFHLGGQINVSDNIDCNKDILRVLNAGATAAGEMVTPLPSKIADNDTSAETTKGWAGNNSGGIRSGQVEPMTSESSSSSKHSSKSRFFKSFCRKSPTTPPPPSPLLGQLSPPPTCTSASSSGKQGKRKSYFESRPRTHSPANRFSTLHPMLGLENTLLQQSPDQKTGISGRGESLHSAYSRFMVLEYLNPSEKPGSASFMPSPAPASRVGSSRSQASGENGFQNTPPPSKKKVKTAGVPQMLLTFPSRAALEILGLENRDGLERQEIMGVLEQASAGGLGKTFRNTVRKKLREGQSVSIDFLVSRVEMDGRGDGSSSGRKGSIIERMHLDEPGRKKIDRVMTLWTPLKDEYSRIGWVLLVITPF